MSQITDLALSQEQDLLARTIQAIGPAEIKRWTFLEEQRPLTVAPDDILACAHTFDVGIQFLAKTTTEEQPYRFSLVKAYADGRIMRFGVGLNIDQAILEHELMADYNEVADITQRLYQHLQGHSDVTITSPLGTDIGMSISGRQVATDPGVVRTPGFRNLPSGECYVAPLETSANGVLVVDKSFPGIVITEPIRLTFEGGRVTKIEGGSEAKQLEKILAEGETKPAGEGCRTIAELGIGPNPYARITGNVMTDEKVMGTIHVAIGHNAMPAYNGINVAPLHLDGVMSAPTLTVDGQLPIDNGKYILV